MNAVEYLDSKGMSNEGIKKVFNYAITKNSSFDFLATLINIYDIMSYVGLTYHQIELLLSNNVRILDLTKEEIIKVAYVLNETDLTDQIFEKTSVYKKKMLNYKRIFIRNFVAKKSGRYLKSNSPAFLTDSDSNTYCDKYHLSIAVHKLFGKNISSDVELEKILNEFFKVNAGDNQRNITVDEYINMASKRFYSRYLLSKMNKKSESNFKVNK